MERLTEKTVGCFEYALKDHKAVPGEFCTYDAFFDYSMAVKRLGHYEDTGFDPEEIADFMKRWEQTVEIGGMLKKYCIDHIRDLLHAEQDGRLVVLPCKVGDHVWADGREAIVVWFFGYKTERYLHAQFLDNAEYTDIPFYEIGKTVFLAREEAEATMKEEKEQC